MDENDAWGYAKYDDGNDFDAWGYLNPPPSGEEMEPIGCRSLRPDAPEAAAAWDEATWLASIAGDCRLPTTPFILNNIGLVLEAARTRKIVAWPARHPVATRQRGG